MKKSKGTFKLCHLTPGETTLEASVSIIRELLADGKSVLFITLEHTEREAEKCLEALSNHSGLNIMAFKPNDFSISMLAYALSRVDVAVIDNYRLMHRDVVPSTFETQLNELAFRRGQDIISFRNAPLSTKPNQSKGVSIMEIVKKLINLPKKAKVLVTLIALLLIVVLPLLNCIVGYNSATQLLVKQSPTGALSCVDHAGFYFKGFSKVYSYDRTKDFYFNSSTEKVKGEGWEGDDTDEDDIKVTLSRNANADISGYLKYQLPTNCDDLIKLHVEQRSDAKVKHELVRNTVLSAVRKTAPLFTAEEAKVTKIAEFRRLAEDQLTEGEYLTTIEELTEKVAEDEFDASGKLVKKAEVQKYVVTKLKLDTLGNRVLTKTSALKQYGIRVLQFEIQNVQLDAKAQQQLDIVKEREMQRVANATAAETAKQTALKEEAEGKARVAKAKADQEVQKITEVTQAEKEKAVAVLAAQKEFEVAELEAKKANEVAKRIKAEGEAEAAANRAKVAAGLTPQEKIEWEYKTKVGIAAELAKIQLPSTVIGGGQNGGMVGDIMSLKFLTDLNDKLSK